MSFRSLWILAVVSLSTPIASAQEAEQIYRSVVPVVGHTLGIGGVEWRSQLAMTNPHRSEVSVGLTLMGGEEPFFFTTLAPGQTLALNELVGEIFGAPGTVSILEVNSMGAGPVSVGVRVLGFLEGDLVAQEAVPVYGSILPFLSQKLHGLTVSDQFRTNLGIANGGEQDATVTLGLQRIDGRTIASVIVPIPGRSLRQRSLRAWFPLLTEGADLTVIAEPSSPEVIVYASVISNSSHGARFVAPVP